MKNYRLASFVSAGSLLLSGAIGACSTPPNAKAPLKYSAKSATAKSATSSTRNGKYAPKTVVKMPIDPWIARRALYYYDAKAPLELKSLSRVQNGGAITEKLTLRGVKGATEPFYIVTPVSASSNNRVLGFVLIHGLQGNIDSMLFIAQLYAAQGYAVLIPEIVNHGERISATHAGFGTDLTSLRADAIESVGDMRRTLDVFAARPQVDNQRIGLVGLSLGSILGSLMTAVDDRIRTAVFNVGGGDWKTLLGQSVITAPDMKTKIAALTPQQIALLDDIDPKNFVGRIAPRPVLMLNGKQDTIIPVASARIFFEAAKQPKKQIWFDSGHFLPVMEAATPINDWLTTNLKNAKTP